MHLKSPAEIEKLAASNRLVAEVMAGIERLVEPGAIPVEIDTWAEMAIRDRGGVPAFKGYPAANPKIAPFPASICFSVNEVLVHGIPGSKPLREGDICSIDVGVLYEGFYGDMARTFPVGRISKAARKLLDGGRAALDAGIQKFQAGNRLYDISAAVQQRAETDGFGVVRDYVGHGIGRELHESPQVPNFGQRGTGPKLERGLALAIEPMLNAGSPAVVVEKDGWTVRTADRCLCVHVEDTVVLTEDGPRILTQLSSQTN